MKTHVPGHRGSSLWIWIAVILLVSCSKPRPFADVPDELWARMAALTDSLYSDPLYVRDQMPALLRQSADSVTWYKLLNLYAKTYVMTGETAEARALLNRVAHFAAAGTDRSLLAEVYNAIAVTCDLGGDIDSTLYWLHRTEGLMTAAPQTDWKEQLLMNLADAYNRRQDFARGAQYYHRALAWCDSVGKPEKDRFFIYTGLGHTYMELRDFERSDACYERASLLLDEVSLMQQATYLNNRGNSYYFRGDYHRAGWYFRQKKALLEGKPEMKYDISLCQINLAEVYLLLNEPDSCRMMLDACRDFFTELQHPEGMYYLQTLEIGCAVVEKDYARARKLMAAAGTDAGVSADMVNIRNTWYRRFYEETGDYRTALDYFRRDREFQDSVRSHRTLMHIAEMEMRYQQDARLVRQELLIERHRGEAGRWKLLVSLLLLLLVAAAAVAAVVYSMHKRRKEVKELRQRHLLTQLKMENIRNRISPHFIFNLLGRVVPAAGLPDARRRLLDDVAVLLKQNLRLVDRFTVSLREELDFIASYLHLEREMTEDDFTYTLEVDPALDPATVTLPSMLLQIPVENALKHGLRGLPGPKCLRISVRHAEGEVVIRIEDNGRGFGRSHSLHSQRTFQGIRILEQTIGLLNASNREKLRFEIRDLRQHDRVCGCLVEIGIPDGFSYAMFDDFQ
ncbi:MAG: histidine kinase [Bacteroides sp.]|nr:histidine kinase [Bacteroides sp.]